MIHLRILGGLELKGGDPRAMRAALAQPKRLALLVYLAVAFPRGYHRRDSLLALFWPEKDAEHARNALRQSLHALRQSLGADVLDSRGDHEVGLDWSRFSCDAEGFERALESKRSEEALALYRGDLLPGFYVGAPAVEQWLDDQRSRLRRIAAREAWLLSDRAASAGDVNLAVQWARHVAAFSPDDESAVMRLIALLGRMGDRTEALRVYESFSRLLADDYQLVPSVELEALIGRIASRSRTQSQSAWSLSSSQPLLDLTNGEGDRHRYERVANAEGKRVAVLPFSVQAAAKFRYLREGVAEMLASALDGAGALHSVDQHAIRRFCGPDSDADIQQGRALAHRFGAHRFIIGTVVSAGTKLRLQATLHDADGTSRTAVKTDSASEARIFLLVDDLSRKILAAEYPGPAGRRMRSATEMTASLPALKDYLEAEREFVAGRWLKAREIFTRALSHDASLAIAWERMGWISCWLLQGDEARTFAARAMEHADRLTEHDALGLQAFHSFLTGNSNDAERLYRTVLSRWPDDVQAHVGLGMTLVLLNPLRARSADEALDPMTHARVLDPENLDARLSIAYLTARLGQYQELDSLHAWLPPDGDYTLLNEWNRAVAHRDAATLDWITKELERAPDILVHECSRYAAVLGRDFAQAQRMASLLTHATRAPQARATGHVLLAQIQLIGGRVRAARQEFRAAQSFSRVQAGVYRVLASLLPFVASPKKELEELRRELTAWDLEPNAGNGPPHQPFLVHERVYPQIREYLLALLNIRLGNLRAARGHTDLLEKLSGVSEASALAYDLCLSVRAQIEQAKGNFSGALTALEATRLQPPYERVQMQSPFFSENLERYTRAKLLEDAGRLDEALHWYDTMCENGVHEFAYLAPSHFRRGTIHGRLGNHDLAAHHFAKVTELWSDCDSELRPMVDDAVRMRAKLA